MRVQAWQSLPWMWSMSEHSSSSPRLEVFLKEDEIRHRLGERNDYFRHHKKWKQTSCQYHLVRCLAYNEHSVLVDTVKIASIKNYHKKETYAEIVFTRFPIFMTSVCHLQAVKQVVGYTTSQPHSHSVVSTSYTLWFMCMFLTDGSLKVGQLRAKEACGCAWKQVSQYSTERLWKSARRHVCPMTPDLRPGVFFRSLYRDVDKEQ